jgi:hypothetical protein
LPRKKLVFGDAGTRLNPPGGAMTLHSLTHVISCKEASRLLSQRQDRPLEFWERVKLRGHLALCGVCTRFAKQLDFMREALRRYRG